MNRIIKVSLVVFSALLSTESLFAAPTDGTQDPKSYSARGVVEKIAEDLSSLTIHHQAIPGYMMAMTMDFNVKNTNELSGISNKDEITFTLVVSGNEDWIENVRRVGHSVEAATNTLPAPTNGVTGWQMSELKPGDLLPDYELTAEDGRSFRISDFRGKALAFTFFFTRCPLPEFCPRMNNYFGEARKILSADPNAPKNWQLLSISFDPGFDAPQILANYAGVYRGEDPHGWLFASAPTNVLADAARRLDLVILRQADGISHNLRTVVLDPAGRIYKHFDGNQWTPQELAEAMTQAAGAAGR